MIYVKIYDGNDLYNAVLKGSTHEQDFSNEALNAIVDYLDELGDTEVDADVIAGMFTEELLDYYLMRNYDVDELEDILEQMDMTDDFDEYMKDEYGDESRINNLDDMYRLEDMRRFIIDNASCSDIANAINALFNKELIPIEELDHILIVE